MKTKKNINLFIHSLVCMLVMLTGVVAQTAPSTSNINESSSLLTPNLPTNSPLPIVELPIPPIPQPEMPGNIMTSRAQFGAPEASKPNELMTMNNLGMKTEGEFLASGLKDSSQSTMSLTGNYTMTDLGTAGGCVHYYPQKVNNSGDVIGYCYEPNYGYQRAFLYRNGQMIILTLGGADHSYPYDINENGDVVGYSYTTNNQAQHAFVYRNGHMIDLGTLGGTHSYAYAINDNGDVIGGANTANNQAQHAFVYRNGQMIDLGTLGGTYSYAHLLSENGDVAGYAHTANNQYYHAFLYRNGQMIDLGTLGGVHSEARGINNNGDVVGWSYTANNQYQHAFVYRNGQMIDLGTFGGTHSYAYAINDNGDVVGYAYTANNQYYHAFLYRNGQMIDLGTLGGTHSNAHLLSENGDVAGWAHTANNQQHAFLYRNGQMINLGTLGGTHSYAYDINDNGDVVGYAYTTNNQSYRAFVTRNGQLIDLGTLGGSHSQALAINDNGDVVGSSHTANNQYYRGFIAKTDANTAPTAVADIFSTNEDNLLTVAASGVLGNDTDAESNALTATLVSEPSNDSSFNFYADGSFSYEPIADFNGTDSFTYKANDGQADSETVTVTITVNAVNDAPLLGNVPVSATTDELVAYGFTATASDIDNAGQTLTFSLGGAPDGASIDSATGAFSWTPSETQGPGVYPFTVRLSDGEANTDANITVTVNEVNVVPTLSGVPAAAAIDELTAYQFTAGATDTDVPAQTLTFSLVGAPAGADINSTTGAFSWTPTETQGNGSTYNFAVRVSDGVVNTDSAIALTVNEVNSAPELAEIADTTVDELAALSGVTAVGTDSDDPANTLIYSLDAGFPTGMAIDGATGAISWTPTELQGAGDYPVTVRVTDNGVGNLSSTRTFNVHVDEVNVAPDLGAIGGSTIDEQAAFGFTATATDADLKTDNTPANDLTFTLENAPSGAAITQNGVFSWTPTETQGPGSYTFKVKVTDDGSPSLSDEETITLTVREVNLPPVLGAINNQTGYWGNPFSFTATATDPDIPANTLTFSLVNAPAGATIDPATGAFNWTPGMSQIAAHTFTVVITDDGTPAMADQQNVTITVGKRPTAIEYNGDLSEQYSDQTALSATLTDIGTVVPGTPLSGKTVRFDLGSQNASASTDGAGAASTNLILTQDPNPVYNVVSTFAGDDYYLAATDTDGFDIRHEDARAYYTGTLFVNTACATCGNATATLSATVKDITAETGDPATDSFEGDIRNATVTFVNRETTPNTPIAGCSNLPVGLVNLGDKKVGTATCNWNTSINSESMDFSIGIVVNNFYARNAGVEDTVVTISKPLGTNFITGGGFLINQSSNGQYAGVTGLKTNFGFNVKYNKSGTNLQGRVNVIVRGTNGRVYQLKGNVMRTLSVRTVSNNPLVRAANYTGKATVTDITDPLAPVALGGNNSFQMELTDKGEPGSTDSIGINVWNDAGGLLFSSRWDGTRTVEQILGGGNLVLR